MALLLEFNQSLKVTILVHKNHVKKQIIEVFCRVSYAP